MYVLGKGPYGASIYWCCTYRRSSRERVMTFDVRTNHWLKPIPLRQFDWEAVMDNYEPGCPIGYGRTEQEAIDDLLEQIEP